MREVLRFALRFQGSWWRACRRPLTVVLRGPCREPLDTRNAGYGALGNGVKRVVMCVRSGGLRAIVVEGDLWGSRVSAPVGDDQWAPSRPDVRIYAAVVAGSGTLTLLFTDLVGSTESLVELGEDRFDSLLDEHDVLVGGTITGHHGEVVKHTGDGV